MIFSNFFFRIRLAAIINSAEVLNSNPFSGPYSLRRIKQARKNREMNQRWFFRNFFKLKKKLSNEGFEKLAEYLGFGLSDLIEIEIKLKRLGKWE
jgi:hypothetical protein